jgi:ribosomal protein S18 acetylase RimI-like enzyme
LLAKRVIIFWLFDNQEFTYHPVMAMKILFDTNIIINLEDINVLKKYDYTVIKRYCNRLNYEMFSHPCQKDDFRHDTNFERQQESLIRVNQYQILQSPPIPSESDLIDLNWANTTENDKIDNKLLFALYKDAVNLFVTNDKDIIKKANRTVGLGDRVYNINDFLHFLESDIPTSFDVPQGLNTIYLYNCEIKNEFFDSLRNEYLNFNQWYIKCKSEHRQAWAVVNTHKTIKQEDYIYALCIYNIQQNTIIADDNNRIFDKILKLCTFKVAERGRGAKLGERLLYTAFKYAVESNLDYIYVTVRSQEHEELVNLFNEYGFNYFGKYRDDDVYLKDMATMQYPNYLNTEAIKKFIVPILPKYHGNLFPDLREINLLTPDPHSYMSCSNSIKKAYLCHSNIKKIREGDLLFFYRTKDRKNIQCMGIVELAIISQDFNQIFSLVSKRTVYMKDEIEKMIEKPTLLILFKYLNIENEIQMDDLKDVGIKGPIQSIRQIPHTQYLKLFTKEN